MTRDFLIRWSIALVVGLAIAPLAQSFEDRLLFANAGADPIPERTLVRSPDQPRGVLHHYVVPGKVSEDAAGAAGATLSTDASAGGVVMSPTD
ncbi:hypothetical protein [Rubricoccus marinus]|uniref:Uncharacterized protein n=1 Tax=Rubricoccus marinus TaxID=716817 RepID=A0A259U1S3_9BACT|nr:hypothetical protein [Rubricoccus marinus]OZC03890.1 hypothetical protein BSZ36_13380 [Rubricoccus marinus]